MRHAIGYALHWPERKALPVERLDLAKIGSLTFEAPDDARYPALAIAKRVMEEGGLSGAAFNAAKERALDGFIAGEIGFLDMAHVVTATLNKMSFADGLQNAAMTLDNVMETDRLARIRAGEAMSQLG
jgi:1-deoxy-D-xylulose-5-phosphate reductoisomerase